MATCAALACLGRADAALAQYRWNTGDRVMCNPVSPAPQHEQWYQAGTVLPFKPGDGQDGSWFRVKADADGRELYCPIGQVRPGAGAPARQAQGPAGAPRPMTAPTGAQTRTDIQPPGLLKCPITQTPVKNGAAPNPELLKRIIRCAKGEKPVAPTTEGAVSVDGVTVQIGQPRAWSYRQDAGNGQAGTRVWPVRASYDVRTHYWAAVEESTGWIRVLNFYVDPFGEWKIGSEESIRGGTFQRLNR